ncbi:exported hypothetical protein [Gammaproteobacteria bacterium]
MIKKLLTAVIILSASPAMAGVYDGLEISTITGKATRNLSGKFAVAVDSKTPTAYTTTIDGTAGYTSSKQITTSSSGTFATVTASQFYGNATSANQVPASGVQAGSLGASVLASSVAVNAVKDASIVSISGSKVDGYVSSATWATTAGNAIGAVYTASTQTFTGRNTFLNMVTLSSDVFSTIGTTRFGTYTETVSSVVITGMSYNISWSSSSLYFLSLHNNPVLTFSKAQIGQSLTLLIKQDYIGGHSVLWPSITWTGNREPELSTAPASIDTVVIFYNGSEYIGYGGQVGPEGRQSPLVMNINGAGFDIHNVSSITANKFIGALTGNADTATSVPQSGVNLSTVTTALNLKANTEEVIPSSATGLYPLSISGNAATATTASKVVLPSSMTLTGNDGTYGLTVSSNASIGGVFYTAGGKAGIGRATPYGKLDLYQTDFTSTADGFNIDTSAGGRLSIYAASNAANPDWYYQNASGERQVFFTPNKTLTLGESVVVHSSMTVAGNDGGTYGLTVSSNISLAGTLYTAAGKTGIAQSAPGSKLSVGSLATGTPIATIFEVRETVNNDYVAAIANADTSGGYGLQIRASDTGSTSGALDVYTYNTGVNLLSIKGNGQNVFSGNITVSSITVGGDLGIKTYTETQSSETISAANYNLEWSSATVRYLVINSSTSITFSGATAGKSMSVIAEQGGKKQTISWPSVKWKGGVEPVLSTTTNRVDIFNFYYTGSKYIGTYDQNYY